jgi:hypothetical protein
MPAEDEVLSEAAIITAGSWYANPASYVWPGPRTACDPGKFQAVTARDRRGARLVCWSYLCHQLVRLADNYLKVPSCRADGGYWSMRRMTREISRASSGWQAISFTAFRQSAALITRRPWSSVFNVRFGSSRAV